MNREFINIFLHTMRLVRKYVFVLLIDIFCPCKINAAWKWEIVFEAFSYGPPNAHALFTGNDLTDDSFSSGVKQHFKHPIVNDWNKINISKVMIEIIQNDKIMAYVTFNGHQSDRKSWMSIENILESSYSDVTYSSLKQYVGRTGFHFSVDGLPVGDNGGHRRFYMNKSFKSCPGDIGWMLLVEGNPVCAYEKGTQTPYNYALVGYVVSSESSVMEGKLEFADSMRIQIEYEPSEATTTSTPETTSKTPETSTKTPETSTKTPETSTKTPETTTKTPLTTTKTPETTTTTPETTTTTPETTTTTPETATKTPETTTSVDAKTETKATITPSLDKTTLIQDRNCSTCYSCDVKDTNLSMSELKDMVQQLQEKLKVDKTKLSKTIRRLNSASDPRPSSMALGVVFGGTIFGSVFVILIMPDVINLVRFVFCSLRRLCRI